MKWVNGIIESVRKVKWSQLSISIVGFLGSSFIIYVLFLWIYSPEVYFEFAGQQSGFPISLPREKFLYAFALGSHQERDVLLEKIRVCYDPFSHVQLSSQDDNVNSVTTNDEQFGVALEFNQEINLKKDHKALLGFWCEFTQPIDRFNLRFIAYAKTAEYEVSFPFTVLVPLTRRFEETVEFAPILTEPISMDDFLLHHGFMLRGHESMTVVGEAAKQAISARTKQGTSELKIISIPETQPK